MVHVMMSSTLTLCLALIRAEFVTQDVIGNDRNQTVIEQLRTEINDLKETVKHLADRVETLSLALGLTPCVTKDPSKSAASLLKTHQTCVHR